MRYSQSETTSWGEREEVSEVHCGRKAISVSLSADLLGAVIKTKILFFNRLDMCVRINRVRISLVLKRDIVIGNF